MRILSLHPTTTELLFAIGAGDLVAGRTDQCTYPPAAKKVPSAGSMDDVSGVIVDVFEPSLVLCGPGQDAMAKELGDTYRIILFAPESLADVFEAVGSLAEELNRHVEAELFTHDLRVLLDRLKEKSAKFRPVRVYCETGHAPPVASSGYVNEIFEYAKTVPFVGEPTVEAMQRFDPQMIVSAVPGENEFNFELLTARDGWESLNAVTYERLFSVKGELLSRPGPRLLDGIRQVAKLAHGIDVTNGY